MHNNFGYSKKDQSLYAERILFSFMISNAEGGLSPDALSSPAAPFLRRYYQYLATPLNIFLSGKVEQIIPNPFGVANRIKTMQLAIESQANEHKGMTRGAFAELGGIMLLDALVRHTTQNEYVVWQAPPQLDMGRPVFVQDPLHPEKQRSDRSGDAILARQVFYEGKHVLVPIMLFDIKASPRDTRTLSKLGVAYNARLAEKLPVANVYLGDMQFTDARGQNRNATAHFLEVCQQGALANTLAWDVLWPTAHSPQERLLGAMRQEVTQAIYFSKQKLDIGQTSRMRRKLLGRLDWGLSVFAQEGRKEKNRLSA